MIKFLKALLGGLGIIRKELAFVKSEFNDFVRGLPGPCLIFTRSSKPGFFGGGIQAITGSVWQHVAIYIGQSLGKKIRFKYPLLMGKRRFICGNVDIELKPIPRKPYLHEIIESANHIRCGVLDEYKGEDKQLAAVIKPLTTQEAEEIGFRAYLMYGMPYDVQEIVSHIAAVPNPEDGKIVLEDGSEYKVGLKVCSSFGAYAFGIKGAGYTPGSLFDKARKWPEHSIRRYNY